VGAGDHLSSRPGVSFLLAAGFLLLPPPGGGLRTIGLLGTSMNLLTAVYSLMPFDPMDENKVLRWKSLLWAGIFVPALIIYLALTIYVF
jgi:Zn-dependent protease